MNLEILILVVLAIAATIFSVLISITVVVRKAVGEKLAKKRIRLYQVYSSRFAEALLGKLPPVRIEPRRNSLFKQYDLLLNPIQKILSELGPSARKLHRATIRRVLIDFSRDLSGESFERLTYFFSALSLSGDELRRLKSRSWWIRAEAANTLSRLRARNAIGPLTAALEDSYVDVRLQAMQGLVILRGVDALRTILQISRDLSLWTTIELSVIVSKFQDAAVPYLIEGLRVQDKSVVIFSIEMLAEIGFVAAVEPLMVLAGVNQHPEVRAKALEALGRLGDMRSRDLLTGFLHHNVESVRLKAIEAIGRLGGIESLQSIRTKLASSVFEEKLVAARALATIGASGIAVLKVESSRSDDLTTAIIRQVLEEYRTLKGGA